MQKIDKKKLIIYIQETLDSLKELGFEGSDSYNALLNALNEYKREEENE